MATAYNNMCRDRRNIVFRNVIELTTCEYNYSDEGTCVCVWGIKLITCVILNFPFQYYSLFRIDKLQIFFFYGLERSQARNDGDREHQEHSAFSMIAYPYREDQTPDPFKIIYPLLLF